MLENKSGSKDRRKVTIGTHQRSFERCHPRPPTASPSPRLGVRNPPSKLQSKIAGNECTEINSLYGRHRIFFWGGGRERMGIARDRTNFWLVATPHPLPRLLTQEQVKLVSYGLQMWHTGTFIGCIRTKAH